MTGILSLKHNEEIYKLEIGIISMKFIYKDTSGVTQQEIDATAEGLFPYIATLKQIAEKNEFADAECSMNCPFDDEGIQKVKVLAGEKKTDRLKYIFLIGIGGSNLGTKAIYDALQGYVDVLEPVRYPKMIFVDTTNSEQLIRCGALLSTIASKDEVLIISISKSGGTAETTANTEIVLSQYTKKFGDAFDRVVVITDENSPLWNASVAKNIAVLPLHGLVGGRYSVFSPVGLFPLLMLGYDIDGMLERVRAMRDECLQSDIKKNPAALSAIITFIHYTKGKNINDTFVFHSELESVGKWYRQLMGESVGKEQDRSGNLVNAGITPIVSVGSTDLHSMGQLYLGGPKDKLTTFIYADDARTEVRMPEARVFPELVQMIHGKTAREIMDAILGGTKVAYTKRGLSYMMVVLPDISAASIGEYFQFKMMEMMYLAHLMEVNAFDQPNVESYKVETKMFLS